MTKHFYYEIKISKNFGNLNIFIDFEKIGNFIFDLYLFDGKNSVLIEKNTNKNNFFVNKKDYEKLDLKNLYLFFIVKSGKAKLKRIRIFGENLKNPDFYFLKNNQKYFVTKFKENGILLNEFDKDFIFDLKELSFYKIDLEIITKSNEIYINNKKYELMENNLTEKEIIQNIFKEFNIIKCEKINKISKKFTITIFGIFSKLKINTKKEIIITSLKIKKINIKNEIKLKEGKEYIIEGLTDKKTILINDKIYNVEDFTFDIIEGKYFYRINFIAKKVNKFENAGVYKFEEYQNNSFIISKTIKRIEYGKKEVNNKKFFIEIPADLKNSELVILSNEKIIITEKNENYFVCEGEHNFKRIINYMFIKG